jgi:dihydrofolate reductase
MTDLTADLFVSVDGFAGAKDAGPFFGYSGPDLDRWIRDAVEQPHVMLMGRVTYETLAAMSTEATDDNSRRMDELPKIVVSNTLHEPLAWTNTRLLAGDLATGIAALKRQSTTPLRTIGSMTLVRSLVTLGLVDRLRLLVFPLTLGADGREPAYLDFPRAGFELAETTVLDSRLVVLTYRPGKLPGE